MHQPISPKRTAEGMLSSRGHQLTFVSYHVVGEPWHIAQDGEQGCGEPSGTNTMLNILVVVAEQSRMAP
jgi:hypothetical protein